MIKKKKEISSTRQAEMFVSLVDAQAQLGLSGCKKTIDGDFLITPKAMFILGKTLIQTSSYFDFPQDEIDEMSSYNLTNKK